MFSPDGRWIAYNSTDIGVGNVYVQSFPPNGARTRISTTTGSSPAWTADGRQIVYVTEDDHYMAVEVTPAGGTVSAGLPKDLFARRQAWASRSRSFMVDPKGERFLLSVAPEGTEPRPVPLTVVVNWESLLRR